MSANVETMFSNRLTPWHGLGEIVDGALSSEEAIRQAGLDWKVLTEPVFLKDNIQVPNVVATVRESDRKVLGTVTDRYKVVQNHEAFAFTDNLLNGGAKYETAGSLDDGRRVWLLARMEDFKAVGEDYENYICFTNSHNGKSAVQVVPTNIRVVCQNTLNIALNGATRSWSTKHMGNMESKMYEASRALELNNQYINEFSIEAERLALLKVNDKYINEFLDELFPGDDEDTRKGRNILTLRNEFVQRYNEAPDLDEFRGTKWGLIQAVSDMAFHMEPLRESSTFEEKKMSKVIDGHPLLDRAYELVA